MNIGWRIKALRKHFRLTQKDLAELANITDKMLSRIETGRLKPHKIPPSFYEAIAEVFQIDTETLTNDTFKDVEIVKHVSRPRPRKIPDNEVRVNEGLMDSPLVSEAPIGIGPRIRAIRYRFDLSEGDLARMAHIQISTLSKLERTPDRIPQERVLHALAAALEIPPELLIQKDITIDELCDKSNYGKLSQNRPLFSESSSLALLQSSRILNTIESAFSSGTLNKSEAKTIVDTIARINYYKQMKESAER